MEQIDQLEIGARSGIHVSMCSIVIPALDFTYLLLTFHNPQRLSQQKDEPSRARWREPDGTGDGKRNQVTLKWN